MYAFIDIVNILGGIEITLDEDLVDPTYRVRNNGTWSTLYYKKGEHHLDGIETLRVARARHFTPVFSRDDRQQKILAALIEKISELSIVNFNQIYEMLRTIYQYLETDITIQESLAAISDLKNIKIINKHVLTTNNVLEQTYSTLFHLGLSMDNIDEFDDDANLGAWILIPRNNDWHQLHRHINNIIKGTYTDNEVLD